MGPSLGSASRSEILEPEPGYRVDRKPNVAPVRTMVRVRVRVRIRVRVVLWLAGYHLDRTLSLEGSSRYWFAPNSDRSSI